MEFRPYSLTLIALLSVWSNNLWALGFGEARALSYLGQPLHLQIALTGTGASEIATTRASIGKPGDFQRLSMEPDAKLARLKLAIINTDNGWVIDIRSKQVFNDPFVEFPLRMRHAGGSVVKAVTVLLDPPIYARPVSRQFAPIASAPRTRIQVSPGDTLWPIAQRTRPANVSTQQMMMALLRRNPNAFVQGNINRLRSDAILEIPSEAEIRQASVSRARSEVDQQMQQWKSQTPAPEVPAESTREPAKGTPPAEQKQAKLHVLKADTTDGTDRKKQVLLTQEELERQRLEQGDLATQIQQIRDEVAHMERLLALKDEQIAALQALVATQARLAQSLPAIAKPQPDPAPAPPANRAKPPEASQQAGPTHLTPTKTSPAAAGEPPPSRIPHLWWSLLLLLPLVWLIRQRWRSDEPDELALAAHPDIVNAPPPPYVDKIEQPLPVVQTPASIHAAPEPVRPSTDDDRQDAPDSLLDEALAEVARFPNEALPGNVENSDINEAELAELAAQLNIDLEELEQALPDEPTEESNIGQFWEALEAEQEPMKGTTATRSATDDISLDMARAYLELGDRKGAIDMLKQVFDSTDDPVVRNQVEKLLAENA